MWCLGYVKWHIGYAYGFTTLHLILDHIGHIAPSLDLDLGHVARLGYHICNLD
jgi:hypothetical protein